MGIGVCTSSVVGRTAERASRCRARQTPRLLKADSDHLVEVVALEKG